MAESFRLGAVGYIVKAVDYKKFVEVIREQLTGTGL